MAGFFTLDSGEKLYLDEQGDSSSPALVCLHGLGGGGYFFAGVAHAQSARRYVLCPDMPGSGFSPRGERPISFERFADAISELIERKTKGPVALLGHSMGTITALMVYSRLRSRIGSLIFLGGLPAPLPEAQARLRDRAAQARDGGMMGVAPTIPPVVFASRSVEAIPDKVAMFQRLLAGSDAEGYAQTALALAAASAVDVVPGIRVPCLCITGTEDRYAPPAAVRAFAATISGTGYHELTDCGHMPFFEDIDALNKIISNFLSKASA